MPEEVFETPQPAQPTELKTTNWPKVILAAVLGLGLLAGACYAGYYYGTQQIQPAKETTPVVSQPTPKTTPTPEPVTPPVEDPTKDWKTYNHPNDLYTLKYPSNLVYKEEDIPNSTCEKELILADRDTGFSEEYQGDIIIDVCPVIENYPFPEAAFANITGGDSQPIAVDDRRGFVKTGEVIFYKLGSKTNIKRIVFLEDSVLFTIDLRYIPGHSSLDQTFNQILSTFKFLD